MINDYHRWFLKILPCKTMIIYDQYGRSRHMINITNVLIETDDLNHRWCNADSYMINIDFLMHKDPICHSRKWDVIAVTATLRNFLESRKDLLERIIGDRKIMISERRSPNTASLLFAKSGFSSTPQTLNSDQRCNARGCLLCDNL